MPATKTADTAYVSRDSLKGVPTVKANTAEKNVKTFDITGDFSAKAVFDALNEAGLTGKVAK